MTGLSASIIKKGNAIIKMVETTIEEVNHLRDECIEGKARYAITNIENILLPMANMSKLVHYCPFENFKPYIPFCKHREGKLCEYRLEGK